MEMILGAFAFGLLVGAVGCYLSCCRVHMRLAQKSGGGPGEEQKIKRKSGGGPGEEQ